MKKLMALILTLVCMLSIVGCDQNKTERIAFPFAIEDVTSIEMYHFEGTSGNAEKKVAVDEDDIKAVCDLFNFKVIYLLAVLFECISLTTERVSTDTSGGSTIHFTFHLADGTNYELTYIGYGIKNGTLKSSTGNFEYFTLADIYGFWILIDLEAVTVEENDLLK